MNFMEAVQSCFRNYANFNGRAPRSEYWFWMLFCLLAGFATGILDVMIFGIPEQDSPGASPLNLLFSLGTLLPGLAVTARRLHDVNKSGWWMLIALTIIGIIPLLIWYCSKGNDGDNRFGSDPLAGR